MSTQGEEIRTLKDYPNYGITTSGVVINFRLQMPMSLKTVNRWKAVVLSFHGKAKLVYVHDLVAEAFLPPRPATAMRYIGPNNEIVVPKDCDVPWLLSFKDGDQGNPAAENLFWALGGACKVQVWMATKAKKIQASSLQRREILGFPLYEIDTDGTVYRRGSKDLIAITAKTKETRGRGERHRYEVRIPYQYVLLNPTLDGSGLSYVNRNVHELLGRAFLPPLTGHQLYWFKNNDPSYCILENLCVIENALFMQIYTKCWTQNTHDWSFQDGFTSKLNR